MTCPINGKPCSKYKAFHVTETKQGKTEYYNICEDCLYVNISNNIKPVENSSICPNCGTDLNSILHGSRLGCAKCYEQFESTLEQVLSLMHGVKKEAKHTGRVPSSWLNEQAESTNPITFATELKQKLRLAIKNEDYRAAANLKTNIDSFVVILSKYQQADKEQAPLFKKALADFICEYRSKEKLAE